MPYRPWPDRSPKGANDLELLRTLSERGLVYQMTGEEKLAARLDGPPLTFYLGFDATAGSLHLGNLVPLMIARYLQKGGHRPIIVVGGGTALVGDPSGRSSERTFESAETIARWADAIWKQLGRFIDFGPGGALLLDNRTWLSELGLIDFLREVGRHFSVNRMLTADSVKLRLEGGISFLEFSYSLLQAYDYLHLYRTHQCTLQVGGSDQWGNIVAGIDLIRRAEGAESWGFTCPLVTTTAGEKMSKSQSGGAVWLDPELTSPYDYYQFWMNVDDRDALTFMKLYTFIPADELTAYSLMQGADLRKAKERLAFEATALVHGESEARAAETAARALFGGGLHEEPGAVPTLDIPFGRLAAGLTYLDLFVDTGLCPTRSDARRMASQGGLYAGSERIYDPMDRLPETLSPGCSLLLRAGKKRYFRVTFT
jgi:tyrosyl-tRNA synthetase